ncbi:MAG: hypothetical protein EP329_26495 [Deltaproteobacteria bacterium]|nr:MAG: hypothetical protein EP329_26495 [Deltaproteobacteria bacterium]
MRALLPIAMIATLSACPSKSVPVVDPAPAPAPALETQTSRAAPPLGKHDSLGALVGAEVLACLNAVTARDEGSEAPAVTTAEAAADGVGPCTAKVMQRVMAHGDNRPIREVAVIEAGTDLYKTVDLAVNVGERWFVARRLFENEDSGCCIAYRKFEMTDVELRDLVPGDGHEVTFEATWVDRDADKGVNQVDHQSYTSRVVCGANAAGGWCRALQTRQLSYAGDLDQLGDGSGVHPSCWEVALDGVGGYTRTPAACEGAEAPAAEGPVERGEIAKLPPL